jgi:2-polyprenyl-6-hydroxyphenyl methylase/3-demethylubiquinone-9 3-methyltransferase
LNLAEPPNAIAFHDELASSWEKKYLRGGFARRRSFFLHNVLPRVESKGLWLDAGCGSGTFSRMLAQSDRTVLGVDASERMLIEATENIGDLAARLSFRLIETVENLPFPDKSFDGVICLSVLEYLERPYDALKEMARTLKPGGTFVFSVPHGQSFLRILQKLYRHLGFSKRERSVQYLNYSRFEPTPKEIEKAVETYGMIVSKILGFDPILPDITHAVLRPSLLYVVCHKRAK